MRNPESDIYDNQASYYINKLYDFIGPLAVEKEIKKHKRVLDLSGPIVSETILRKRHPWWEAFSTVLDMRKRGMSIKRHLTPEIKMLAGDALKIIKLKKFMPDSVQRKYKRDLITKERAFDYLFEIQIAWHYYLKNHELQWYEDDGEKHPEFLVKTPNFDFNVECKRISVDIARKIKRKDFSRFAEALFSEIEKKTYSGNIDIILNDRLESNQIDRLVVDTLKFVDSGKTNEISKTQLGDFDLNLYRKNGEGINLVELEKRLQDVRNSSGTHAAFFAPKKSGDNIIDPIFVSLKSRKPDKVLDGIYDKIYEAALNQLIDSMPGIIVAFLEDVYDLRELGSGTGLQIMTNELLSKKKFSHIAGISYCSETQIHSHSMSEIYNSQNLFFRNPHCKFENAKTYQFIDQQ
ncbi:hypothetical protein GWN26_14065 [Candidatus Saccharibacteria bacterium]|nr:hypothetical protein [Candidatus Saccharibacteria bacterium]NIW80524.1 hypothetical protein [Calditrichia bacterium]